jgi:hypothetical protein
VDAGQAAVVGEGMTAVGFHELAAATHTSMGTGQDRAAVGEAPEPDRRTAGARRMAAGPATRCQVSSRSANEWKQLGSSGRSALKRLGDWQPRVFSSSEYPAIRRGHLKPSEPLD